MSVKDFKFVVLPGNSSPQLKHWRALGRAFTVIDTQQQNRMMRITAMDEISKDQLAQIMRLSKQMLQFDNPAFLKLLNTFIEGRFYFQIYQFFPFQPINQTDKSTMDCLSSIATYLDKSGIIVKDLNLNSFGAFNNIIKIIPPFKLQFSKHKFIEKKHSFQDQSLSFAPLRTRNQQIPTRTFSNSYKSNNPFSKLQLFLQKKNKKIIKTNDSNLSSFQEKTQKIYKQQISALRYSIKGGRNFRFQEKGQAGWIQQGCGILDNNQVDQCGCMF